MSKVKTPEVWVIRNKKTKEQWTATSGKSSWKAINHAKAAWANSHNWSRNKPSRLFKDQDEYEVVKLVTETEELLEEAIRLLDSVHEREEDLTEIRNFLYKVNGED